MEPLDPDNRDLAAQMSDAVDYVQATPDLPAVLAGAARSRRRSRSLALGGAVAVVALGVGGVIMVSNRDTNELPAAQPDPLIVPFTTLAPGAEPSESENAEGETPTTDAIDDEAPDSTIRIDGDVQLGGDSQLAPDAPDPADQFLGRTEEIYRREMPSGYDLQIRMSQAPFGDLFGIEWDLPTGSQQDCLGNPAVFIGNPTGPRSWLSSWTVQQWWPIGEANDFQVTEYPGTQQQNIIVRTDLDGVEAGVLQGGTLFDNASFVDGIAVIELPRYDSPEFEKFFDPVLSIATRDADGVVDVQTLALYSDQYGSRGIPEGCAPPPFPGNELPEPGAEQPADQVSAELSIRDRHAVLVDQSIEVKPEGLLTDETGVAEARAEMEAGEFGASAASAEYTIDDVVFTDAHTAWFQYGIVAPTGTFGPRFGQAIFNGEVWQITRQTICQDLSLAGGQCDDAGTPTLQPPIAGGVDEETAIRNWQMIADDYSTKLNCNPVQPCGDFDLSLQLPGPGEQPDDADAVRRDVVQLMESLYGDGALLVHLDRIDDPTGIAETVEESGEGADVEEVDSTLVNVVELVFTSPTSAVFRYDLRTNGFTFGDRIGFANEIDGVWKIARDTVCDDLSLGQVSCDG